MDNRKQVSELLNNLQTNLRAAHEQSVKEGYEPPSGTYTFSSREASVVNLSLRIVDRLVNDDPETAFVLCAGFRGREEDVSKILREISNKILHAQCPAYITKAVDQALATARETDPSLS